MARFETPASSARADVGGRDVLVIQRHLLEDGERGAQLRVDRRRRVVVEHLLRERCHCRGGPAATAAWQLVQKWHLFIRETNAAKSSRSPIDHSDGPRITACVCARCGVPNRCL
jgi:hypothetical protein